MLIRSTALSRIPGLSHALSTTTTGPLGGDEPASHRRRAQLARRLGASDVDGLPALVVPHQVHGAEVRRVTLDDAGRGLPPSPAIPSTDGLVTTARGLALMVQGADCPLILAYDPTARVLGVAHSGWRGTVAGIGGELIRGMEAAGADASDVHAAVFPGICAACFEVGPEVVGQFVGAFGGRATGWARPAGEGRGDRLLLDLTPPIRTTLEESGLDPARIDLVGGCTFTDDALYSHRASGGDPRRHALVAVQHAISPALDL